VDFFSIVLPGSAWVLGENEFFNLYVPLCMFFLVFNWFHGRRRIINEVEDRAKSAQNQIDSPHEE
jgi:hypothetical protein